MPTYDYSCEHCGHKMEVSQKITEPALKKCPECKQESFKRGIGGGSTTLRFVGSGFYINDYKKDGNASSCSSSSQCCPNQCDKK